MFCHLIQQSCETIDRTRAHAGIIFEKLLYNCTDVSDVTEKYEYKQGKIR